VKSAELFGTSHGKCITTLAICSPNSRIATIANAQRCADAANWRARVGMLFNDPSIIAKTRSVSERYVRRFSPIDVIDISNELWWLNHHVRYRAGRRIRDRTELEADIPSSNII